MVYITSTAGNRHFCDLTVRVKDVINIKRHNITPEMQDLAAFVVWLTGTIFGLGTGKLHT